MNVSTSDDTASEDPAPSSLSDSSAEEKANEEAPEEFQQDFRAARWIRYEAEPCSQFWVCRKFPFIIVCPLKRYKCEGCFH